MLDNNGRKYDIPPGRKGAFYVGMAIAALGLALFLSTFVSSIFVMGRGLEVGSPMRSWESPSQTEGIVGTMFPSKTAGMRAVMMGISLRAFGGLLLMMVGSAVMAIGSRGLAGAGLVLNPRRARRELGPWSRMMGGIFRDAFEETGLARPFRRRQGGGDHDNPPERIKVRCPKCKTLNDEEARFCDHCGAALQ